MADDLIQSSMAGAQQVPANFDAQEADNLEDVSTMPSLFRRLSTDTDVARSKSNLPSRVNLSAYRTEWRDKFVADTFALQLSNTSRRTGPFSKKSKAAVFA